LGSAFRNASYNVIFGVICRAFRRLALGRDMSIRLISSPFFHVCQDLDKDTPSFSQRMGIEPTQLPIQSGSMNNALRTGLWNACGIYWDQMPGNEFLSAYAKEHRERRLLDLVRLLWSEHLKRPLDQMDDYWSASYREIRQEFFRMDWNKVYDFIEFLAANYADKSVSERFMQECNAVLKREASAYRFVSGKIAPIVSDVEIVEIEKAMAQVPLRSVHDHLESALRLLSDKQSPDYRNSMKESISAVEALCKVMAQEPKASLPDALDELVNKQKAPIHLALRAAFEKLYGYASSADGIRHALTDQANLDVEDAMFTLVACSAFINYLTVKADKAGIALNT
jgi:hypothetical protein